MQLRRLLPDPRAGSAEELCGGLDLGARAPENRPYVIANFIASADGRATLDGRSAPLGNPADRALFHQLRTQVDAVLAGTRTLATERYGRIVPDAGRRAQREREGLAADALAVVVTRSGAVPWEIPLFHEPQQRVAVFAPPETAVAADVRAAVTVEEAGPDALTPAAVLHRLRTAHGVRSLLCEGGPTLLGAMAAAGLVDELLLCVAPLLAGGAAGPRILQGPDLDAPIPLDLVWALESEGALFLRYALAH